MARPITPAITRAGRYELRFHDNKQRYTEQYLRSKKTAIAGARWIEDQARAENWGHCPNTIIWDARKKEFVDYE